MQNKIPLALSYDDVLLVPQYSEIESRSDVDLTTRITPNLELKLPLISINMTDVTGIDMAVALGKFGGLSFLPRFMSPEEQAEMVSSVKNNNVSVGAAIGIKEGFLQRAELLVKSGADILTIDVAHGSMKRAIDATKTLKEKFGGETGIISGVVASYEGAKNLFEAGADSVRVGVGPGTICTTRVVTGVGVPQITAVTQAKRAAEELNKTILCDGGTKSSGDIVKGLAAGASAVVIGGQLAGTEEAPGKKIEIDGKSYKEYNASTSKKEKNRHVKTGSAKSKNYTKHIEGVEGVVPHKGPVSEIIESTKANIKSGLSYCGARNIQELWKKAQFVRITSAGARESNSHDIILKN